MSIIGNKIWRYQVVTSTNDEAKRLISAGEGEGTVIIADQQTAGRGKPGRTWFSAPGSGLYLSVILFPFKNPADLLPLTLTGARAVVSTIWQLTELKAEIKQPNDVLLRGKKICGILTERIVSGQIIMGLGVNLNHDQADFPAEIAEAATSLKQETSQAIDQAVFCRQLLQELDQEYLAYLRKIC